MNRDHDLELNACLDGELSEARRIELELLLAGDAELQRRFLQLRQIKAAVASSYRLAEPQRELSLLGRRSVAYTGLIAAVLLLVGFFTGAAIQPFGGSSRFVLLEDGARSHQPAMADSEETRIVFHLTNPDQVVAGELLDEIELLLARFRDDGDLLRIEVVSHGEGLDLLRQRLSRHRQRIAALADTYQNLAFVACRNTIDRLRVEKGIEVMLVPEAETIDSGVSHVVKRQMEGWSYIRV